MIISNINIILADDHHIVRGGLKAMLEQEKGFTITGEAANGKEALNLLEAGSPANIILVDVNMPVMGGMELTELISKNFPAVKVIILSALDNEQYIVKAFRAGASAYLLKNVGFREISFAIRHTDEFGQYICAELSGRFINRLLSLPVPAENQNMLDVEFSDRDVELLSAIAEGFTNQEIADKLFTSIRTVENHRQQLINKTGSRNTVALIRYAMLNGII